MITDSDFVVLASEFVLGMIAPSNIVDWASERVALNDEVLGLAMLPRTASVEEVSGALAKVLANRELEVPTWSCAAKFAAMEITSAMVAGAMEGIEGARRLWSIARLEPSIEPEVRGFIGLASEWEDDESHRIDYEQDIITEAAVFLQRVIDEGSR